MRSKWFVSCAAAAVTIFLAPVAAFAADAPADSNVTVLPEVLVQARRVTENQQKTPVAVTTVSKDVLRITTVTEVNDIQKLVPSFEIKPNDLGGAAEPTFTIRGLQTSLLTDPSVVTYVDGVVQDPRNFAYSFYDLESVQVLKGPQGTLFGKNSTGGAFLIHPTRPGMDFGGYLDLRYGNLDDREVVGAVNLPVNDQLQFRLAGEWEMRDGTLTSTTGNFKYDNRNHGSIRGEMMWKPSEFFDNYAQATYYRVREMAATPIVSHVGACPVPPAPPFPQGAGQCYFEFPVTFGLGTVDIGQEAAQQAALGKNSTVNATPTPFDVDYAGITDVAQIHPGYGLTIRNIAHADSAKYDLASDLDGTNAPIVGQSDMENNHFYSDELQVLGTGFGKRLNWIVGGYWSDLRSRQDDEFQQLNFPGNPIGDIFVHDNAPAKTTAIFAQGTWDFSEWVHGLSLTGGYRYTWDSKSFTDQRLAPGLVPVIGTDCALLFYGIPADPTTCTRNQSAKWSDDNYNVSLNWQATDNLLLYVATRKGYKAGGFNFTSSTLAFVSYAPEELKDVEFGLKADWRIGDMPVRTNFAIYQGKYDNIQAQFPVFTGPIPQLLILNKDPFTGLANKATMSGFELEVTAIPMHGVTVNAYYGYAKGKYDQFVDESNPVMPIDLKGQSIAGITPTTEGASITWSPDTPDSWGRPVFGAFLYHQGQQSSNGASGASLGEASFTNLDLRLDWRHVGGGPVDLAVYGKNVTDNRHLTQGTDLTGLIDLQSVEYAEPATYGIEIRYHFGAGN